MLDNVRSLRRMALASVVALAALAALPVAAQAQRSPYLGIEYYCSSGGLRVIRVYPGWPANSAGLQAGNLITLVDNKPVGISFPNPCVTLDRVVRYSAGSARFTYRRHRRSFTTVVTWHPVSPPRNPLN